MACASSIEPTEGKTRYLRWMLLLIDGGTMVLRDLFDMFVPPPTLANKLHNRKTHAELVILHKKQHKISDAQYNLLYPQSGLPDSSTFDITLLICLLQNICGLDKRSTAWSGLIDPADFSIEADICRLRKLRNEHSHSCQRSMTEQLFPVMWAELEQILLRLGNNIPGLQVSIDCLRSQSIDQEREQELFKLITEWEAVDKSLQASITEIKDEQHHHTDVLKDINARVSDLTTAGELGFKERDALKATSQEHANSIRKLESDVFEVGGELKHVSAKLEEHDDELNKITSKVTETLDLNNALRGANSKMSDDVEDVRISQERMVGDIKKVQEEIKKKEMSMSSELRSLASMSKMYFEDATIGDGLNVYVETRAHCKAKEILLKQKVLVISGHPGEGKTTMSLKLISETSSAERCLKLRDPSDWKHVDLNLGMFDTVLIDDIYGAGVVDDKLVKDWEKYLPDIYMAAQKNRIRVIITTRHYILQDAKETMRRQALFKDDNIILLSSKDLSESERYDILRSHLNRRDRNYESSLIEFCLRMFDDFLEVFLKLPTTDFVFGFPQCVEMFASNDELFFRGSSFFSQPNDFFRKCIEDLYKDEEKFLALIMIWSRQSKPLLLDELDLSSTSHELTKVAKKFGFKLKPKLIKILRRSLGHHAGGFLDYNSRNGSYSFSHNVIGDMVGLVLCKDYPTETLECSSRDFILKFVTTDQSKMDDFHFYIEEHLYTKLSNTMLNMFLNPHRHYNDDNFNLFKSGGNCPNTITPTFQLDSGLVTIDAFENEEFVGIFVNQLQTADSDVCEKFLTTPVIKMSGHFLGYGIKLEEIEIDLPMYFLLNGRHLLLKELISREIIKAQHDILEIPLMIATYHALKEFVIFLLEHGARVTEEVVYIAAMDENVDILPILMQKRELVVQKKSRIFNDSNALLASAKKGYLETVKCLVENGADLNYRNADGLCALDKAVLNKHTDICKVLIEAGSSLNTRAGKFKRTPLHVAADMGQCATVELLLHHGSSVTMKDHRGHYAIHCAAMQGHVDIVKQLLTRDISLSKQRIISYSQKSVIKGMTVYHIAVWKNNMDLLNTLVELKVDPNVRDIYGRTPFYCAVYDGKLEVVEKLLHVCDPSLPEKQGFTPLHAALHKDHIAIAKLICPLVDVNMTDKFGKTPLHIACIRGHTDIARMLILDFKADWGILTKRCCSVGRVLVTKMKAQQAAQERQASLISLLTSIGMDTEASQFEKEIVDFESILGILYEIDPDYLKDTIHRLHKKHMNNQRIN